MFEAIHIEYILINKAIYFNFENMTALYDSNANKLIDTNEISTDAIQWMEERNKTERNRCDQTE
jgi:hypothetical protein